MHFAAVVFAVVYHNVSGKSLKRPKGAADCLPLVKEQVSLDSYCRRRESRFRLGQDAIMSITLGKLFGRWGKHFLSNDGGLSKVARADFDLWKFLASRIVFELICCTDNLRTWNSNFSILLAPASIRVRRGLLQNRGNSFGPLHTKLSLPVARVSINLGGHYVVLGITGNSDMGVFSQSNVHIALDTCVSNWINIIAGRRDIM